jgi:hypothetical protein
LSNRKSTFPWIAGIIKQITLFAQSSGREDFAGRKKMDAAAMDAWERGEGDVYLQVRKEPEK